MATAATIPGTLNITLKHGDSLSQPIDFDFDMTGLLLDAEIVSAISGKLISPLAIAYESEADGTLTISLSAASSEAIAPGAYLWRLTWEGVGVERRTGLEGIFEVIR